MAELSDFILKGGSSFKIVGMTGNGMAPSWGKGYQEFPLPQGQTVITINAGATPCMITHFGRATFNELIELVEVLVDGVNLVNGDAFPWTYTNTSPIHHSTNISQFLMTGLVFESQLKLTINNTSAATASAQISWADVEEKS